MKVYENEFMAVNHLSDVQTLELDWKPATSQMKDFDFKGCLYVYACFAIECDVRNLLILIQNFAFGGAMSDELTDWRNNHIFPKYNEAVVKKWLF